MYIINSKSKSKRTGPPVGQYTAKATSIEYHPDFVDEEAFIVTYDLFDPSGVKYTYSEVFFNDEKNPRTVQYIDYCDNAGIPRRPDGLPKVIGLNETVVLKRRANYRYPVIVDRNFISYEADLSEL